MDNKKQEVKREIIKHAVKGRSPLAKTADGPNYPSKASHGIYQSGPWSDSLDTTYAKVDKNLASKLNVNQTPPGEHTGSRISTKPSKAVTEKPKSRGARAIPPGVLRIGKAVEKDNKTQASMPPLAGPQSGMGLPAGPMPMGVAQKPALPTLPQGLTNLPALVQKAKGRSPK